jgi:hypothetical protein
LFSSLNCGACTAYKQLHYDNLVIELNDLTHNVKIIEAQNILDYRQNVQQIFASAGVTPAFFLFNTYEFLMTDQKPNYKQFPLSVDQKTGFQTYENGFSPKVLREWVSMELNSPEIKTNDIYDLEIVGVPVINTSKHSGISKPLKMNLRKYKGEND